MYSLYTVINPATFPELPSNSCSLATSACILGHANAATPSAPSSPACAIIACSTASCFYYCHTTCSKLMSCRLIVYSGGSDDIVERNDNSDSNMGDGVGGGNYS